MKNIKKAFSGLNTQYYFRQLFFATGMALIFLLGGWGKFALRDFLLIAVSVPLYPYSRFVYESVVRFVMGENIFFTNVFIFFVLKIATMLLCFFLAVFIAPLGLIYLYLYVKGNESGDAAVELNEKMD